MSDEQRTDHLEGRVSVLENSLVNLTDKVTSGFEQQQKVTKAIWDKLEGFSNAQKPNYVLAVALAGLMITLGGVLYSIVSLQIQSAVTPTTLKLQEVETQFNADAQLRNVQWSEAKRNEIMFSQALHDMGASFPVFPTGPAFQPNISKAGASQ